MTDQQTTAAARRGCIPIMYALAANHRTPEDWLHQCITAADEAYAAVMEGPPIYAEEGTAARLLRELGTDEDRAMLDENNRLNGADLKAAATEAAAAAFKINLPPLAGRKLIQSFLACVVAGLARHYLHAKDANALLYAAQQALTAWPKRRSQRGRK